MDYNSVIILLFQHVVVDVILFKYFAFIKFTEIIQ